MIYLQSNGALLIAFNSAESAAKAAKSSLSAHPSFSPTVSLHDPPRLCLSAAGYSSTDKTVTMIAV